MEPRMSKEAVAELDKCISGKGLEWGSGTSTVWLAQRSEKLVSIEHDGNWYQKVGEWIKNSGLTNIMQVFIPPTKRCDNDICFYLGKTDVGLCYRDYVNHADKFEDVYFDYIIVDGRARVGCLFVAMSKLKPQGLLILDNSERVSRYGLALNVLDIWPETVVEGYVDGIYCKTSFWRKPNNCGLRVM